MNKLRVGFPLISSRAWMGGYNYLLNLVSALARYESERIEPVIFCGDDTLASEIQPFMTINGISVVRHPGFSPTARRRGLMQAILLGADRMAVSAFNTQHIDVIFESARFFGWRLPQASIAWLPDFQHRRMPHLFKRAAWWHRELGFQTQVLTGRTLLLSSEDARRDCERF